jgi:hypothetical protein
MFSMMFFVWPFTDCDIIIELFAFIGSTALQQPSKDRP